MRPAVFDPQLGELWKMVGLVFGGWLTYRTATRGGRVTQSAEKTPAADTVTIPTPPGRPDVAVDVTTLPAEMVGILRQMSTTFDHMQTRLAAQAEHIGRQEKRIAALERAALDHQLVRDAFREVVEWIDAGAPPPPPTIRPTMRVLLGLVRD